MARRSSKSSGSTRDPHESEAPTEADAAAPETVDTGGETATDSDLTAHDSAAADAADTIDTPKDVEIEPAEETAAADTWEAGDAPPIEAESSEDTPADATADQVETHGEAGDDTLAGSEEGADSLSQDGDTVTLTTGGDETVTLSPDETAAEDTSVPEETPEPAPAAAPPPPQTIVRRGPGFVPLLLGGVVAAGIGYGAAYLDVLPVPGDTERTDEIAAGLQGQADALAAVEAQVAELAAAEPVVPDLPEVDFGPVLSEISALSGRIDTTTIAIEELGGRVAALEERPIFTGEVDADSAAMAVAVGQLEEQLRAQQETNAAMAEELRTLATEAQAAISEAESRTQTAIAEAEARAAENVAAAAAQAALSRVRIAMAAGDPFADALSDMGGRVDVPEALADAAETGVPTLEDLQAQFPALARAALPIALRETAGDGTTDRLGAFLRGQIGGRSVEPREGDDPDAILSRVEAAVRAGDLETALSEIGSLPEGARAELAGWVASVETRAGAEAALDTLAAALDGAN